jgi:hypothetical protein
MQKTFWLVERYIAGRLHYWSAGAAGRGSRDGWSTDVGFATKLADNESADQVMLYVCGGEGRSVEHSFLQPA